MTSTPSTPRPATGSRRRSLGLRFLVAFLLGIALVAGVGGGALYAYGQQYEGRVLPGVRVGDLDLSGMTPVAARRALAHAYASAGAGRVIVDGPDGDLTIGYGEIGRHVDVDALVEEALAFGRKGEPVADLIGVPQAALRGVTLEPRVSYDTRKLADAVAAVAKTVDEDPVDATLTADQGVFTITEGRVGRTVDQAALVAAIRNRIAGLDAPAEVREPLALVIDPPTVATGDAEAAKAAGERMAADLVLKHGTQSWTIPGASLRRLISFSRTVDGSIVPVVDVAGIDPLVKRVAKDVDQAARSAGFKYSGGHIVAGVPSRQGRALDVDATRAQVIDALVARQGGTAEPAIQPVIDTTNPVMTTAQAKQLAPKMREISSWTTWFPIWSHNGFGANIWIPARLINGYVVQPGATFDFWKVVGAVTYDKGYKRGGAIINGRTEALGAIGGGICSCSTTLFNAALRAGYEMGARRNHYYYIDRYPLGLDATVFISNGGSKQTMSWTNDTRYPVLIRGINTRANGKGYVTFKLYSVPTHRTVTISAPTVKNVRKAGDSTERSSTLRAGYSQRIEWPADGKDVWRTVTVRENGRVIRRTTYYSHYSTVTGVVLIGTGGPSAPTSVP
jgi:vancomycin resistance protein YoaR